MNRKMISKLTTAWAIFEVWEHGTYITNRETNERIWITKNGLAIVPQTAPSEKCRGSVE